MCKIPKQPRAECSCHHCVSFEPLTAVISPMGQPVAMCMGVKKRKKMPVNFVHVQAHPFAPIQIRSNFIKAKRKRAIVLELCRDTNFQDCFVIQNLQLGSDLDHWQNISAFQLFHNEWREYQIEWLFILMRVGVLLYRRLHYHICMLVKSSSWRLTRAQKYVELALSTSEVEVVRSILTRGWQILCVHCESKKHP